MRRRDVVMNAGLGALALAAPAVPLGAGRPAKTLVFGGSVPLTGAAAETGLNVNNGYITAATYINEVLGGVEIAGEKYKIELKLFDDASDPARATTLIQRQLDEGTNFFLGSFGTNIVLPTVAITERAKKPMVQTGGGSDAIFTRGYKYVFGMYPRATRQFASAAALFKSLQPTPQTYSVIYTNDAFSKTAGQGVKLSCDAAGFKRLDSFELPAKPTDVSSVLGSVRAKTPGHAGLRHARPGFAPGGAPDDRLQHQREAPVPGAGAAARLVPRGPGQVFGSAAVLDLLGRIGSLQGQVLRRFEEVRGVLPAASSRGPSPTTRRVPRPASRPTSSPCRRPRASSPKPSATRWPPPTTRPSTAASSSRRTATATRSSWAA